ncbi:MAG TPA: M18 family aminopeptidase [Acidimicrobiales bacterium]|nr:M18 family aminopeptidase [Acidimicrobiales bacterium]
MSAGPSVEDLLAYLDASPTPYHAAAEAARRLAAAGSVEVALAGPWTGAPARGHIRADGALVAWILPDGGPPAPSLRLVGAHTDSPGLRIKPRPDTGAAGWRQLGVEVYGGALVNSWLDRDLGLAGRVAVRSDDGSVATHLVRVDEPVLRVPQLAIHLDRELSTQGLKLDRQRHLTPVWGVGTPEPGAFRRDLASRLDVAPERIGGWDLMVHDLTPAAVVGTDRSLVASGRLDDLCACWAGLVALAGIEPEGDRAAVLVLFDHEEVGSTSTRGAGGPLLADVLERLVAARGGTRSDLLAALPASALASADMAHATHPNHAERHEPGHWVAVDGGPVVKVNANQRYATEPATQAAFEAACDRAGVPFQYFVGHNEVPCGSTIGPLAAAGLGLPTVDVGVAQLAMHSARELCGREDPLRMAAALGQWFLG